MSAVEEITRDIVSVDLRHIDNLIPYARNARTHPPEQIAKLAGAIVEFGFTNSILADDQGIIAGHGRVLAARQLYDAGKVIHTPAGVALPIGYLPVVDCSGWSDAKRRSYILWDNQSALLSGWDDELVKLELQDLSDAGYDLEFTGFSQDEIDSFLAGLGGGGDSGTTGGTTGAVGSLAARFGIPPFSVLNAREGWWQARKAAWLALGIRSEVGRGENLLKMIDPALEPDPVKRKAMQEARAAAKRTDAVPGGGDRGQGGGAYAGKTRGGAGYRAAGSSQGLTFGAMNEEIAKVPSGTSIFDPVLCELAYRWFCPPGGQVLDPFAGGSVRGVVAAKLGRRYQGHELRAEQCEANRAQAAEICAEAIEDEHLAWVQGDSAATIPPSEIEADFVFTCPPYGDLEVYSDEDDDLSNMSHADFLVAYRAIIAAAIAKLKPDRFAAVVVGDFRDKAGIYRNFVSDTIAAFQDGGAALYNEAILVTAVGSLPIRAGKQFAATRKLGKTHQNVLVFVKGDPAKATAAVGECDFGEAAAEGVEEAGVDAPAPLRD